MLCELPMTSGTNASRGEGAPASTAPDPTASLQRIEATLARLERRLDALEAQATSVAGIAADTVDRMAADARAQGVDVDARVRSAMRLAVRLTDPAVVAAVEQALDVVPLAPGAVAMAVDTFDGLVSRLRARGVDVEARARLLGHAMERLTSPEALELLGTVLTHLDAVRGLLDSGVLDPAATRVVGTAGASLVKTAREPHTPGPGPLGLVRALGDVDVRAVLGFTLRFARNFGRALDRNDLELAARNATP